MKEVGDLEKPAWWWQGWCLCAQRGRHSAGTHRARGTAGRPTGRPAPVTGKQTTPQPPSPVTVVVEHRGTEGFQGMQASAHNSHSVHVCTDHPGQSGATIKVQFVVCRSRGSGYAGRWCCKRSFHQLAD